MSLDLQMKILVVEDFKITRKMEIKILKELGFENITEAEDGETAIQILRQEKDIQLIISDWNMPRKSGYDLLMWVRSDENYQNTPFIMATAQAERTESDKVLKAGTSCFISKPFEAQELRQVIEESFGIAPAEKTVMPSRSHKTDSGKIRLTVAHIQITDHLVLGVLRYLIGSRRFVPKYFELETRCLPGWNPVQKALEKGETDAALVLAPIAMDMFSAGVPIRLVLFAHKNGSICVKSKKNHPSESFQEFFKNKIFYIPHMLSVHHMLSDIFFHTLGLRPGFVGREDADMIFEVIPPIRMPEFVRQTPEACGFMVAQPVGAKAIEEGGANLLFLSGELWEHHPCCVVAMQDHIIQSYPDAVYEFTDMLVQAGHFIKQNPEISALIGVGFLDPEKKLKLSGSVLESVIREPYGIRTDDLFPVIEDLDKMQRYMSEKMKIGRLIDLEKFTDTRFAEAACKETERYVSVMHDPADIVKKIFQQ